MIGHACVLAFFGSLMIWRGAANERQCESGFSGSAELDLNSWRVSSTPDMAEARKKKQYGLYSFNVSNGKETFKMNFAMVEGVPWPHSVGKEKYEECHETVRLRPRDIVVATYPKSGTTWVEQIVLLLVHGSELAHKLSPQTRNAYSKRTGMGKVWLEPMLAGPRGGSSFTTDAFDRIASPRVIKSHAPYCMLMGIERPRTSPVSMQPLDMSGAKVIYVARNAKDAALSLYYQRAPVSSQRHVKIRQQGKRKRRRQDPKGLMATSRRRILSPNSITRRGRVINNGRLGPNLRHSEGDPLSIFPPLRSNATHDQQMRRMPMDAWCALYLGGTMSCGSYFDHVAQWHAASRASKTKAILFLTYEELKRDSIAAIKRIAAHLGLKRADKEIAAVDRASSFDAMRTQLTSTSSRGKGNTYNRYDIPPGTRLADVVQRNASSGHLRQGTYGTWRASFNARLSEQFDAIFNSKMNAAIERASLAFDVAPVALTFDFGCAVSD